MTVSIYFHYNTEFVAVEVGNEIQYWFLSCKGVAGLLVL